MRQKDIAKDGFINLVRHWKRTILTSAGVVLGCGSILIMISIVLGSNIYTEAALSQMGELNVITVEKEDRNGSVKLTDEVVSQIKSITHADVVIPKLVFDEGITLYAGSQKRFVADGVSLVGENTTYLEKEGFELASGDWVNIQKDHAVAGEYLAYLFMDTMRPEGYNQVDIYEFYDYEAGEYRNLPDPYVDLYSDDITMVFGDPADTSEAAHISIPIRFDAALKSDWIKGYQSESGIMMDTSVLSDILDQYSKISGKKYKEYSEIKVVVDEIANVGEVEQEIRKLCLRTSSMEDYRKQIMGQNQQKQMTLLCVGLISLIVAIFGIANTMFS